MRACTMALALGLFACGPAASPPPAAPSSPAAGSAAPAAAPSPPQDPVFAAMNLGFEHVDGSKPAHWTLHGAGYELLAVTSDVHGGEHALRIRAEGTGDPFAAAIASTDAKPYLGKHVALHGFIRTEDAGGGALFLRVDRTAPPSGTAAIAFDNMGDRAITGTHGWTEATVEVDVPPDASALVFGPFLSGGGTAWFDDLRVEVTTPVPPAPITLEGTVVGASGPLGGAEVALVGKEGVAAHAPADASGHFHFATLSGTYGLSAVHAGAVGGFVAQKRYDRDAHDLRVTLPASGGVTVHGHTQIPPGPGTVLQMGPFSDNDADVFAVPVAADGTFETILPRGDRYYITELGGDSELGQAYTPQGDRVEATVVIADPQPAPQEVVDYLGAHAIALATVEAGHGFDDLAPVGKLVGDAHVVALGEATHGSREIFQLKHRMLEYLVAKKGFTVFALEANQPECRAIDEYVQHGTGTARDALKGIYFWTWDTEEVLAMIEWMRAWNADAAHKQKVHFVGFDMQTATVARANVAAFVKQVASANLDRFMAPLAKLPATSTLAAQGTGEERAAWQAALAALATEIDAHKTVPGHADARHDVTLLQEFVTLIGDPQKSFDVRDQGMADNLAWVRAQHPGARIVVWAHNGHIANKLAAYANMGSHLRAMWKQDYLNLGFVFGDGAFQAMDDKGNLGEHALPAAPPAQASAAFQRTGKPLLVLDLRALPATGAVHDWFFAPHPVRETGAVFTTERAMTVTQILPQLYDGLIYIATTTRARPL